MKTGKLINNEADTNQTRDNEKPYIPVPVYKNYGQISRKRLAENSDSTRLQELSLINHTIFGAIHYGLKIQAPEINQFYMSLQTSGALSEYLCIMKKGFNLSTHSHDAHMLGIPPSYVDQNIDAT